MTPTSGGTLLQTGQLLTASLAPSQEREYTWRATTGANVTVYLDAVEGSVSLEVRDATAQLVDSLTRSTPSVRVDAYGTVPFTARVGDTYRLRVRAGGSAGARFRLYVWPETSSPEHRTMLFAIGDTVSEEDLAWWDDTDRFVYDAMAGTELVLAMQFRTPIIQGRFDVTHGETTFPDVHANAHDELEDQPLSMYTVPYSGRHTLTIQSSPFFRPNIGWPSPYRFVIYPIRRAPETARASFSPGDTLASEALDRVGDIDEFTVTAVPNAEYNLFLQRGTNERGLLRVDAAGLANGGGTSLLAVDAADPLYARSTGIFRAGHDGRIDLRVSADAGVIYKGPYRIFLYPIDRRPEHAAASLALGDSVVGETIELPGDIDEFTLTIPQDALGNFVFGHDGIDGTQNPGIGTEWIGPAAVAVARGPVTATGAAVTPVVRAHGVAPAQATSTFKVEKGTGVAFWPAGTYRLRVAGLGEIGGYRGPYRLYLHRVDSLPETASANIVVGAVVSSEQSEPVGDIDVFTFTGTAGQKVNVRLDFPALAVDPGLNLILVSASTGAVIAGASQPVGNGYQTGTVILPAGGEYRVIVQSNSGGEVVTQHGAYRVSLSAGG
ncbi:MAG TPA: hypothetical protein VLE53_19695 [Gemmatimonadaceae bacterium]|nr:hypothetical protein [Gemmatimonadaceae bacterium]